MLSKSIKRRIAILLTGIMVLGSTVTAFADEPATDPVTSISSEGEGKFEGHVNRKVVDVTLPTVSANTSPFSFIYDGEGLINETAHAAYGSDFDFGAATSNVYFKTADKTYGDKSYKFTVSNNSSISVNIALQVDVTAGENDPKLLPSSTLPTGNDAEASLYLGLEVTGDAQAANGDATGTYVISQNQLKKTFCVAGNANNYSVSTNQVSENAAYPHIYEFKKDKDATDWDKIEFQLVGAANKVASAKGKTAPNLTVTWSFEPAEELEEDAANKAPSIAVTSYDYSNAAVVVAVDLGSGSAKATGIDSITFNNNGTTVTLPTSRWAYEDGKITFNAEYIGLLNGITRVHSIKFNDTKNTTVEVTLKKAN